MTAESVETIIRAGQRRFPGAVLDAINEALESLVEGMIMMAGSVPVTVMAVLLAMLAWRGRRFWVGVLTVLIVEFVAWIAPVGALLETLSLGVLAGLVAGTLVTAISLAWRRLGSPRSDRSRHRRGLGAGSLVGCVLVAAGGSLVLHGVRTDGAILSTVIAASLLLATPRHLPPLSWGASWAYRLSEVMLAGTVAALVVGVFSGRGLGRQLAVASANNNLADVFEAGVSALGMVALIALFGRSPRHAPSEPVPSPRAVAATDGPTGVGFDRRAEVRHVDRVEADGTDARSAPGGHS